MTGFGTKAFTDPDDYRANFAGAEVGVVVTGRPPFEAQLSWADMSCLRLLAIEEKAPRVAFFSLPPASLVFSFSLCAQRRADLERPWIATGRLRAARARRALPPARDGCGSVGPDRGLSAGPGALQLRVARFRSIAARRRPSEAFGAQLRRIAATTRTGCPPGTLQAHAPGTSRGRPRARTGPDPRPRERARLGHGGQASAYPEPPLRDHGPFRGSAGGARRRPEVARAMRRDRRTGADPADILRARYLGCGPIEYARLRRLNLARSTLLKADPKATSVAESRAFARLFGARPLCRRLSPAVRRGAAGDAASPPSILPNSA